ncbi:MAG: hypothetical protein ACRDOK_16105 [Streptosporangiaceae bacterium]
MDLPRLLVVDGYVDLDQDGRPGLGACVHAEFGIPVIGVAKSRFRPAMAGRFRIPDALRRADALARAPVDDRRFARH